jgi:hypothetical protein
MSDDTSATRPCPKCSRTINAAATLCGYCWTRVAPVGADGEPLASWVPPSDRPWWKFWG